MPRFCLILALLIMLLGSPLSAAQAQTAPLFSAIQAFYGYGDKIVFQATLKPSERVTDTYLILQPTSEPIRVEKISFDEQGQIAVTYDLTHHPIRPFVQIAFWFRAITDDGKYYESDKTQFDYIDNRETWQSMDDGVIQVNWLRGDLKFGQDALNSAVSAAKAANNLLPGQIADGVRIYIYESALKLQEALNFSPSPLTVGQASPDLGVVLVSIAPGDDQQLEMDRQIPHELMHVMLYRNVRDHYSKVPLWLNEGMASLAETFANPDYTRSLKKASTDNSLLPISGLCDAFPEDASGAFLAYAQSTSFVRFLQNKFGIKGLMDLLNSYKNELSCVDGVQAATGSSLEQLDYRWRQETLGIDTGALAVQNLSPYLLLSAILLVIPFLVVGQISRRDRK